MRKYMLLIILMFLLSGCDVDYRVTINKDNVEESTTIVETLLNDKEGYGYEFYSSYLENPLIPLSKNYVVDIDPNKVDLDKLYNVVDLTNDKQFGVQINGVFNENAAYIDSNILNIINGSNYISDDDFQFSANIANCSVLFDRYDYLNNLNIILTINDFKVISNNADDVNGNIYTWKINRDNYKNKEIILQLNKINSIKDTDKVVKKSFKDVKKTFEGIKNLELTIGCIVLVLVGFILYKFISFKQRKSNEL